MAKKGLLQRYRSRLELRLTRDWSFEPGGSRRGGGHEGVLVITRSVTPTVAYYVTGSLTANELSTHRVVTDADLSRFSGPGASERITRPTRIILVRTPADGWANVLVRDASQITEVIWLIDDDIPAAAVDPWLPEDYKLRLCHAYLRFRSCFAPLVDRIWAANPVLARRFPAERVEVVPPRTVTRPELLSSPSVTLFYHGTAAHRREHEFLIPILEAAQGELSGVEVEIVGGDAVYRKFRHIPRTRVVHPLPWPDYLGYLRGHPHHVGLVPLMETPFNCGRSAVKLLEIASIGAMGVYSRRAPYLAHAGEPRVYLCGDDPAEWLATLREVIAALGAAPSAPAPEHR